MLPATPVLLSLPNVVEVVFAKDQPQYLPLPSIINRRTGMVTTRWQLSWKERLTVLMTGNIYHQQLAFGGSLQPIKMMVMEPRQDEVLA